MKLTGTFAPEQDAFIAEAKDELRRRLDDFRYAHSVSVAETARSLAMTYGLDQRDCYIAGLLHDWDKDLPVDELMAIARKHDIFIPEDRDAAAGLLHAQTAEFTLRERFPGIDPKITTAVARHTIGAVGMSTFDEAIYIADLIEPLRTHGGLDELRVRVGKISMDELFFECYVYSMKHLVVKRRYIHPWAIDIWNSLVERSKAMGGSGSMERWNDGTTER